MSRQDKGKTRAKTPERPAVGGGGAATSAGILFQQQVGAVIGTWLLADRSLDHRLDLGEAKPEWMRFETEAPVDDIMVGTSDDGIVAIQAKTSVSLSKKPDSEFGKTISQFVQHWLACRNGDGSLKWNRSLDAQLDRLVFAVGPGTPATVRKALPDALRLKSQPGGGQLNAEQQRAFDCFETCFRVTWAKTTVEPYSPEFTRELAALIKVIAFNPEGSARESATATLASVTETPDEAPGILTGIEAVCATLMAERGGVDRPNLRRRLQRRGIRLLAPQDFRQDIDRLKDHSSETAGTLKRFEEIEAADGKPISIVRECQDSIRDAAIGGSLLIIGEPGAGKSGVLNALARDLMDNRRDVFQLAVDGHSVETLEGLGRALGLEHDLLRTLEAWDGTDPAWLIVDGLDAARGGPSGGVFRTLIEQVMSRRGRWKVISSIRTFDLRMGQKFQEAFKGRPPIIDLSEGEFSNIRHVKVPPWTSTEFAQLLAKAPDLRAVMKNAPQALKDIATVPFNTRLLSELVKDGLVTDDLSLVASQAELLQLYWKHRIKTYGAPAQDCIQRVVKYMVKTRVLRAPFGTAVKGDAAVLDDLESAGVLISDVNRLWIQFRHHILFDFAAARVFLDPDALIAGESEFSKAEARGLILAPALMFVLREIWSRKNGRAEFWTAAAHVLAGREGDPVIRSAAGRICAELPERHDDMTVLAERIVAGDKKAAKAFTHVCGAFAVRLDDCPESPLEPWVGLVRDIAPNVAPVWGSLRFLLFRLVGRVDDKGASRDLGTTARALLDHALSLNSPGSLVPSAIDLVGDTYSSDALQSRALLEGIFVPERLDHHAAQEVPALCRKIDKVAAADPEFAVQIYRETYGFDVEDARETNMSDSQILPLRSNARQDYDMARYALKEFFAPFVESNPNHAIDAIVQAVEAHIEWRHTRTSEMLDFEFHVDGRSVRLREDLSHLWAHDPERDYGDDADTLVNKLLAHLRSAEEPVATSVAARLVKTASLAIFWSRLFLAASERGGGLLDFCLPIAMRQEFLFLPDTSKDAVDVVARGYKRLSLSKRKAFETDVSRFDFSRHSQPEDVRIYFERRLFGEIGEQNLATDHARAVARACGSGENAGNNRPLSVKLSSYSPEPYQWIPDLDRELTANRKLMDAIDHAKNALELESDVHNGSVDTLEDSLRVMEALAADIDRKTQHPKLIVDAEGQISKCIDRMVDQNKVPGTDDDASTARFLDLLRVAVDSAGPESNGDTEANFERHVSWGSPAPRVDAAKAALELARQRPDLYSDLELTIDGLLRDTHPAVRLEATLHLVLIWDVDRAGFWRRFSDRLAHEPNAGVIDHICAGVLGRTVHADAKRTERMAFALLDRFEDEPERHVRLRKSVSDLIAILWVTYERKDAHALLKSWISDGAAHVSELSKVLAMLRMAFVAGLTGPTKPSDEGLRHRSQAIAAEVVAAANARLESHFQIKKPSAEQEEVGRNCALLLDAACLQLYFAAKAVHNVDDTDVALGGDEQEAFFEEVADTLTAIGDFATPHTVHYLLELCEFLLPVNPARAFDLVMHAVRSGGRLTGYQFESMGADLLVKLVGLFLADHNEMFKKEDRRNSLVECLEIFMDAGWPAAQRLLYRLPELI